MRFVCDNMPHGRRKQVAELAAQLRLSAKLEGRQIEVKKIPHSASASGNLLRILKKSLKIAMPSFLSLVV